MFVKFCSERTSREGTPKLPHSFRNDTWVLFEVCREILFHECFSRIFFYISELAEPMGKRKRRD